MSEQQPRTDVPASETEPASDSSSVASPPPPPVPSKDPKLQYTAPESNITSTRLAAQVDDIFKVPPLVALKLLSAGVEALVTITGDIPPTPPPTSPTMPNMRGMEAEKKNIVRSHSERSLARLLKEATLNSPRPAGSPSKATTSQQPALASTASPAPQSQPIDGVQLRTSNPTSPPRLESQSQASCAQQPYIVIGENSQPLNLQHSAITRRFYSKAPPPISITDYLLRIHAYCPMSTAVYLATSTYIHRLAVVERAIVVTRRNAHRLLLAGLRVAMKALEDLSYPHAKVARVGGVSEAELGRLEVSFCFLTGFELTVGKDDLTKQWEMLKQGKGGWGVTGQPAGGIGMLRLERPPAARGNTSEESKANSRKVLESYDEPYDSQPSGKQTKQSDEHEKDPGNVYAPHIKPARGLKASISNPGVSEEAKQRAQEKLDAMQK
ncbi:cyclin-dependent protein kinase [Diplogelasinospora grovesii]|uniref:Cyclin-dependent protein kinase n=1 Tax=Diplogelasinospora grovesii TaxID=303347 RepID=A0AAN6RZT0_9PEZI|nr:cyclin-dependent protein kinase [Diplogelasinospora grovesii]